MRLCDLEAYNKITIQCHDNPDADALASGFGLYCYFSAKGIDTRLVYSGKNTIQKANMLLMIEKLNLPVEYIPRNAENPYRAEGLLITVDGQYGAGNVSKILADEVAIIDHHKEEIKDVKFSRIESQYGSCSTLVWIMLREMGYQNFDKRLSTALYYGLYMDTNMFAEISNPVDMDMRDSLEFDKSLISRFRNSNLSLQELEIAGLAMIRTTYNSDYRFAMVHAKKCDPNIMGIISDFLLQVDEVDTCVVFNEEYDGYKFSVRSCIEEVSANELAAYLSQGIGSGGGHSEKAGGFISLKLYEETNPTLNAAGYFNNRMTGYFDAHEIIHTDDFEAPVDEMLLYSQKAVEEGYIRLADYMPVGSTALIRTEKGERMVEVQEDNYMVLTWDGEVDFLEEAQFAQRYEAREEKSELREWKERGIYIPKIKAQGQKKAMLVTDCAKVCVPQNEILVYAKKLDKTVKVFAPKNQGKYVLGRPGDYLLVQKDNLKEVSVVRQETFEMGFEPADVKILPIS